MSAELAGALLGRCGCRRRGGVGAKAAPVHYVFVGGLPRRGRLVGLLPMRARTRSTSYAPPVHGLRQAALREGILVSGCALRLEACRRVREVSGNGLRGGFVGARRFVPGARAHKVVERVAPSRADDAVTAERDIAKRTSLSITTRNAAIRLDGARYNKLHIPLLCGHRHSPPAKRSH